MVLSDACFDATHAGHASPSIEAFACSSSTTNSSSGSSSSSSSSSGNSSEDGPI